jgi:hypothetical protein
MEQIPKEIRLLIAGGSSGALTYTVIAPLERVKLLLQIQVFGCGHLCVVCLRSFAGNARFGQVSWRARHSRHRAAGRGFARALERQSRQCCSSGPQLFPQVCRLSLRWSYSKIFCSKGFFSTS